MCFLACEWCSDLISFSDLDPEEEKAKQKELEEEYKPLLDYLKKQAGGVVQAGKRSPELNE